ncbi:MAG: hypothetical protein Q4A85_11465 [Kingella sp. (in: b-proteobacteria)]|nr:hypothetical protein [Kingella sp. (in: b-proteobacteria)]
MPCTIFRLPLPHSATYNRIACIQAPTQAVRPKGSLKYPQPTHPTPKQPENAQPPAYRI